MDEDYTTCPVCKRPGFVDYINEIEYKNAICETIADKLLEAIADKRANFGSVKLNQIVILATTNKK